MTKKQKAHQKQTVWYEVREPLQEQKVYEIFSESRSGEESVNTPKDQIGKI